VLSGDPSDDISEKLTLTQSNSKSEVARQSKTSAVGGLNGYSIILAMWFNENDADTLLSAKTLIALRKEVSFSSRVMLHSLRYLTGTMNDLSSKLRHYRRADPRLQSS